MSLASRAKSHLVEPGDPASYMGGHLKHTGSPGAGAKLPAAHGTHPAAANDADALPAAHRWHAPAVALANVPGPQGAHASHPSPAKPAGHGLQRAKKPKASLNWTPLITCPRGHGGCGEGGPGGTAGRVGFPPVAARGFAGHRQAATRCTHAE